MTNLEKFLISKGYIKYIYDAKNEKFFKTNRHVLSSMVNLHHYYIHKDNKSVISKIEQDGKIRPVRDFTSDEYKSIIIFGLNEAHKPPTLISPRPRIRILRYYPYKTEPEIENENYDDSMNIVLMKNDIECIFKAMHDDSIIFEHIIQMNTDEKQTNNNTDI